MIIIYGSSIPNLFGAEAIFAPPFLFFASPRGRVQSAVLKHELTHAAQLKRDGYFSFTLKSIRDFAIILARTGSWYRASTETPFELEAYSKERRPLTRAERKMLQ